MRTSAVVLLALGLANLPVSGIADADTHRCSSFMLDREPVLLYGHNLDSDEPVPGMVCINKRGVLKKGCTFRELTTADRLDPSTLTWISQFGSVTFTQLGANFPDGGMNEVGLFVWEQSLMNTTFIQDETLPKLFMMQWMQYVLDNCSTVEEALRCARSIAMDGWNWQFFVADRDGGCAGIAFIEGEPVVHTGDGMPVAALGNAPYADEVRRLKYFQGFGGGYSTSSEGTVPGFVLAARLLREYSTGQPAVDYGFRILRQMEGIEPSRWSVICDPVGRRVCFRTDRSTDIKTISLDEVCFSNQTPVQRVDVDIDAGGNVTGLLDDLGAGENRALVEALLTSWWDPDDMPEGWTDMTTLIDRFASYYGSPVLDDTWEYAGVWKGSAVIADADPFPDETEWEVVIRCEDGMVGGDITDSSGYLESVPLDNFSLVDGVFCFTFRKEGQHVIGEVESHLEGGRMLGTFRLYRMRYEEPGRICLEKHE